VSYLHGFNLNDSHLIGGGTSQPVQLVSSDGIRLFKTPNTRSFSLSVCSPRTTFEVLLPATVSSFGTSISTDGSDTTTPYPPAWVVIKSAVRNPEAFPVDVPANTEVPTNFSYWISDGRIAQGLRLSTAPTGDLLISGAPAMAGTFVFAVSATDFFTGESKLVAIVGVTVLDCGNTTCFNGGTCVDADGDPANNVFSCLCLPEFTGLLCNTSVPLVPDCASEPCFNNATCIDDANPYNRNFTCLCPEGFTGQLCDVRVSEAARSLDEKAITGMAIGAFAALLLVGAVAGLVVFRRIQAARMRKDYHIFIRCVCGVCV
jgi:hypothetical protein